MSLAVLLVTLGVVVAAAAAVLADAPAPPGAARRSGRARALPGLLALLVGLMALFSMIPEGAVLDWSALYLEQELGASVEAAGLRLRRPSRRRWRSCASAAIRSATGSARC